MLKLRNKTVRAGDVSSRALAYMHEALDSASPTAQSRTKNLKTVEKISKSCAFFPCANSRHNNYSCKKNNKGEVF